MPIYPNSRFIPINHPILGKGLLPSRIGPMSVELAKWLKFRLDWQKQQEEGNSLGAERTSSYYFKNPETHEWNMRCMLASIRAYKPELCTELGYLTPTGRTLAELVFELFQEKGSLVTSDANMFKSETWTKTDQVFIMGQITIRQAAMLKLLWTACLDAEQTNREELDEEFRSWQTIERRDEEAKAASRAQLVKDIREDIKEAGGPETYLDVLFERELHNEPQSFQARVIGGHGQERKAFVPTAIFGQRARNDLTNLIRYGLVDLKAVATGLRGRPKHIVRVSQPGQVVVTDLTNEHLI